MNVKDQDSEFLCQKDYNGGRIITQSKKDKFIAIITLDYHTYDYILWKSNTTKEIDRNRSITPLLAKIEKYKDCEPLHE
jgi:hypothetical protein